MDGHKSCAISCCFLVFYVLMAAGCSPSTLSKVPKDLPPIIKEYKHITIQKTEVNAEIYLGRGETYSILVQGGGGIFFPGKDNMFLNEGFSLEARIGKNPYFAPLTGTYYNLNGTTRIADSEGSLYLGVDLDAIEGCGGETGMWNIPVTVIVWKTDVMPQIAGILQEM